MMHNVSIAIILSTVIEQYSTEARFYETQLGIDREQWEAWKNGTASLTPAENQKIKLQSHIIKKIAITTYNIICDLFL